MDNNKLCHIIGLNSTNKKHLIDQINKKEFNIIDIDSINQQILDDPQMDKLYKQFIKLKDDKNDKFKEVDKKMTTFWERTFDDKINEQLSKKKKNIFIGLNNHYKISTKKINLNTQNNFIIASNNVEETKLIIESNLDTNRTNIINGNFPLEYLNFDFLLKKRETLINSYIKSGYIEKKMDDIINILKVLENDITSDKLWISLKEPYNVNSKLYPKNNIIYAYNDPTVALIESFDFEPNEVLITKTATENDSASLSIKELKQNTLEKLKKKRFLYWVDKNPFLPYDNNKTKYFTQLPVSIKNKEKINNVYEYLGI